MFLTRSWFMLMASCLLAAAASTAECQEKPARPAAPAESWRGVHVMAWGLAGGPEGLVPLKEAVEKVLAPLGVNTMILEVGYNYDYKSHPELRQTKYVTKADVRELVRTCRTHGIRVIPQFNCLGHQSWRNTLYPLLTQYRELEELPDDKPEKRWTELRSWCPLEPKVNPIVFALMDELIDAFEADAFHVGMDEVLVIASKKCSRCKDKTPAEAFARAVNDYHRHLVDEKKLTMLMWGDRLIDGNVMQHDGWSSSTNGTAPAIDLIPKDIVLCDWHYDKRADYPSVRYFQEKGFRVWPASWNNVDATRSLIACAWEAGQRSHVGAPVDDVGAGAGRVCPGALGPTGSGSGYGAGDSIGPCLPSGDGRIGALFGRRLTVKGAKTS